MSLRARVVLSVTLVFLIGAGGGAGLAGWHARQSIDQELHAGLVGGRQTLDRAFEGLARSDHPTRDLAQMVATFDGDRHVRALLLSDQGRVVAASHPFASGRAAPAWFDRLMRGNLAPVRVPTPPGIAGFSAIVLRSVPANDVGDVWLEFSDVAGSLAMVCALGFAMIYLTIGRALRPLRDVSESFLRIGSGDYGARVRERGPPELSHLARGFNGMAARLAAMETRNRALEEQLLTLQDEERADLARDLHDEIGPYLFAVNVDAAMVGQLTQDRRFDAIPERLASIQAAIGHMQSHVRDILGRLRPTRAVELGLNAAIEDVVAFWRARRGDIAFDIRLVEDESLIDEAQKETIYRVVQESLNNAVRHGRPDRIEVAISQDSTGQTITRVSDNGAGKPKSSPRERWDQGGFGLIGMRERVAASGGLLSVDQGVSGQGWTVLARLPAAAPRRARHREAAA
ncbi:MAG TPA: histidine kinase [Caulobacteraceae bacterium]|jgi:two-component system sensor histidine kinase UhpB|nr:histidine kinase [Caulobacteraceae bacterium]